MLSVAQATTGNPEKYITIRMPDHPLANTQGRVREHRLKVYNALGYIPAGVHIHHVNSNPKDNRNENLVVCTPKYHQMIHARTDALDVCGDASKMKCAICGEYDHPENMYVRKNAYQAWHRRCASETRRVSNPKTGPYRYGTNPKY